MGLAYIKRLFIQGPTQEPHIPVSILAWYVETGKEIEDKRTKFCEWFYSSERRILLATHHRCMLSSVVAPSLVQIFQYFPKFVCLVTFTNSQLKKKLSSPILVHREATLGMGIGSLVLKIKVLGESRHPIQKKNSKKKHHCSSFVSKPSDAL